MLFIEVSDVGKGYCHSLCVCVVLWKAGEVLFLNGLFFMQD